MHAVRRLSQRAESFEPRGLALSLARSLLAAAQLSVLVACPDDILFGVSPQETPGRLCSGLGHVTLWCLTGAGHGSDPAARAIAIAVLGSIVLGLWPRWLSIAHWYIAFSFATRTTVLNGGEEIAQILTLLLVPICLGDTRRWQWTRPDSPMTPQWRGVAYAGHLLLRCQVAIVYLDAAVSKLEFPSWRSGTAVRLLINDPEFGLPAAIRPTAEHMLAAGWAAAAVTWGVVAIELSIGASTLSGKAIRRVGVPLAVCLHGAIAFGMGLISFSLIMISLLVATSSGSFSGKATHDVGNHAVLTATGA